MKTYNTIIIGAGQAGLCLSYYLTRQAQDHLILEKEPHTIANWRTRWDSFTIVLPNWTVRLPDHTISEHDPNGFIDKADLIKHFDEFAQKFNPTIHFKTEVISLAKEEGEDHFTLETNKGKYSAKNVVAAVGTFQHAHIPDMARHLSADLNHLHTDQYTNPQDLPQGGVLIVGSGQSGAQIAEELHEAGRQVYLSVGKTKRFPRNYRGRDGVHWFHAMGGFDARPESLEDSRMRFGSNPILSGKGGGRDLDIHKFARDGIRLLGRLENCSDYEIELAPNLHENITFHDDFISQFKRNADKFIAANKIDAPPESNDSIATDGFDQEIIEKLDLKKAGINTLIWATGYRFDYSWIHFPILDGDKYPVTNRGVTDIPGLYFLGLQWLWKRASGLLIGIGEDAKYISEYMAAQEK